MVDYQTKLKALKVDLPNTCIVHQALNTLLPEFSIIKTNYNSQDESWSINDLISRVVAEEEKLNKEKCQVALYVTGFNSHKGKKPKTHTNKVSQRTIKNLVRLIIWVQISFLLRKRVITVSFASRNVT
ncbi:UBN2 domain-containing protein [Cephalotus follicularis]|uniref:UBN2 domain-containing protein n=1 Tax=Cephalotus follicularis TaxID=3775 RepID=A0A1Q3BU03_CEPFO|nr:UBN2 domain-containing protein [Cephalotus follicularis]